MELNELVKTTIGTKKRIGRGLGSGKGGHTVGRGQKGQKARGKIPLAFQGSKFGKTLFQRLPLFRGKGKFKPHTGKPAIINLKYLNMFAAGETVDIDSLVKKGIIIKDATVNGIKILGEGEIKIPLVVRLKTSGGAKKKIEKAGGKVEVEVGGKKDIKNKEDKEDKKDEKIATKKKITRSPKGKTPK